MKSTQKIPLWVPIFWFITAGFWLITLILGVVLDGMPDAPWLTLLRILCVVASLAAGIANMTRYKKTKE